MEEKTLHLHSPHILLILLLFLTTLPSTTPTSPPPSTLPSPLSPHSPPTRTQQFNNIIDALIGASDFTSWVSILSSSNSTTLPVTATLFIPQDRTMDRPPLDPFIFPYHVVPQRLTFSELLLFPRHARLPTLLNGKSIFVTDNSRANFSLDATPVTHADLYITPSLAVHGVEGILDYSMYGDGIPPSPPFLPIGDTIGTAWKSKAKCVKVGDGLFVFLLFFSFVLVW